MVIVKNHGLPTQFHGERSNEKELGDKIVCHRKLFFKSGDSVIKISDDQVGYAGKKISFFSSLLLVTPKKLHGDKVSCRPQLSYHIITSMAPQRVLML